jgi:hypothetical protein
MTGIYLTQEGKQAIEAKIKHIKVLEKNSVLSNFYQGQIAILKEILSSATVLPVEESWENVELYPPDNESQFEKTMSLKNGVIIKSKEL